jgi:hypothetical protein
MTNTPSEQSKDAIRTPDCPRCGKPMHLARIEPDKPEHDRRTFQCETCGEPLSEVVKYR